MKTRIISGLIGIILLIAVVYIGSPIYNLAVLGLTLIALHEYRNTVNIIKDRKIPYAMNILYAVTLFFLMFFKKEEFFLLSLFIYLILNFCEYVLDSEVKTKDLALSLLGGFYIVFFMSYLYYFADSYRIWYVFLIASGSDTFAYFIGRTFGKHKLAPNLSPKKTIEGFAAGIIGGVALGVLFASKFDPNYKVEIGIMAAIVSLLSVFGDIFASKIKRETGIKDYGNIMPGHGGILDRFDSIIFTAPVVYYFMNYIVK